MAEPYLKNLMIKIEILDINYDEGVVFECKHFFSGAALYANGNICATLTPVGFGIKLPTESVTNVIDTGDGKELRYFENSPIKKEYVVLSQTVIDDPDRLKNLIRQSIAYVLGQNLDT